jgi:hypothetical protein
MIEQLLTLENLKKLLHKSKEIRGTKQVGWQEKYLVLEGEIMRLQEHLEAEFVQLEMQFEIEQGRLIH